MDDLGKLESLDELIEGIDIGLDIEFYIGKTRYLISWMNHKCFIATCPDGDPIFFEDGADLVNSYLVNGTTPLKDVWKQIGIWSM